MTDQIDLEELIDAKKRKTNMTKRAFRVGKLKTVQDVVAETAKLYRRTLHGHVDSNDARSPKLNSSQYEAGHGAISNRATPNRHRRHDPEARSQPEPGSDAATLTGG